MRHWEDYTLSAVLFSTLECTEAVLIMNFSGHDSVLNISCVELGYSYMGLLCPLIFYNLTVMVVNCKWES